jgi:hypothetical protein
LAQPEGRRRALKGPASRGAPWCVLA